MNDRLVLMDDEKEKLVDEILDLRQRVRVLQAELEALKKKSPGESEKSDFSKSTACGLPPHRWGRKKGHPGVTLPKPTHIDREVFQELSSCPDCHHDLGPRIVYLPRKSGHDSSR